MGILNIELSCINLDNNFDEDDPAAIIHVIFTIIIFTFGLAY